MLMEENMEKFAEMLKEDKAPKAIVKELGLEQVSDEGAIMQLVEETIAENDFYDILIS